MERYEEKTRMKGSNNKNTQRKDTKRISANVTNKSNVSMNNPRAFESCMI